MNHPSRKNALLVSRQRSAPRARRLRITSLAAALCAVAALASTDALAEPATPGGTPGATTQRAEPASDRPSPPDDGVPIAFPRQWARPTTTFRDTDLDGIDDTRDACVDEAETVDGTRDEDGCPDAPRVHVDGASIRLDENVQFSFASAAIDERMSTHLLNLALFLSAHPEYRRVLVLGHADDTGPDGFNLQVSRARARAVIERLVAAGIDPARLTMAALGEMRPAVPGTSDRARRANRRVELTIVERSAPVAVRTPAHVQADGGSHPFTSRNAVASSH